MTYCRQFSRIGLLFLLVFGFGCAEPRLSVYAPPEFAGAQIKIDGKIVATLSATTRNYRWVGWRGLRKELNTPPRSETFAHLTVPGGDHLLHIEKEGFEPILRRFTFREGEPLTIDLSGETPRPVPSTTAR